NVDSIEQRAADAANVALDLKRIAFTRPPGIAQIAARTRVHGRYEDEAGREGARSQGTGNSHAAFFERLAKHVQTAGVKFRQLVEKENAVMSQADLAGRGDRATADHAGVANGVVGRAKRPRGHKRFVRLQSSQRAVNSRGFQAFGRRQGRKDG